MTEKTIASEAPVVVRQNYFLVAGEVVIQHSPESEPTAIRVNAIGMSTDGQFSVKELRRIKKTLQHTVKLKLGDEIDVQFVDTTISNIMFLGYFTPEEFNPPVSTQIVN